MFSKNKMEVPNFNSRSEAFDYMFTQMCDKGADLMDAADRANSFADIIAKNRSLPDAPPAPKSVVETGIGYLKQIVVIKNEYPEVWDLAAGAIGGLIGAFAGSKATQEEPQDDRPPVNFDELE